ncbi:Cyclic di-GMP phosphodiesterase response regulator RpfG [Arenibacter antarcticus]|uniref:Response regulator n=1 Tax=Arenibacter antarcticus TaxID=2040469 RepID=A0ABW5VIG8_9FLAO|nr:response regulator [Arenibacter sp. H213]MCM4166602.1 response regulator [Arenibacter sp. H213]
MEGNTVWIIDDDMVSQFAMTYKIEQSYPNYQVVGFYTVEEALTMIKACAETQNGLPNIILLDLVLPEINGWDFLEELENIKGRIDGLEIYIVSAFSNTKDRKLAKEHPLVIGYFDKPINKGSVDEMFDRAII